VADGEPDVFLSYSRKNKEFVEELHGFLIENEKDVWVDWEDIPVGSEWRDDIATGIDAAAGFVFVVSSTSLASEECAKEVDHALGRGKRIVPIVCDDSHPSATRDEIRNLNWVLCRDGANRVEAFERVLKGLDTDLEWTREHARLTVRAAEWEKNKRNPSFLMRGSDLQSAEQAIAAGAAKDPQPTELHSAYVLASRHASTRRQRLLLGGVSIALAVAIGLGILSLLQRNDARAATRAATSVALASASNDRVETHPDQALLLALAAYESSPSAQARGAAVNALEEAQTLGVSNFLHGDSVVKSLAFSPRGWKVAVGSEDGTVRVWNVRNHKEIATLAASGATRVVSVGFGAGGLVMAASDNGTVRIWKLNSSTASGQLKVPGGIAGAAISPDSSLVAAADGHRHVWFWNRRTGSRKELPAPPGPDVTLAFSHDGGTLAVGVTNSNVIDPGTPGEIAVYDTASQEPIGLLPNDDHEVSGVAFARHGDLLATSGADLSNTKYDPKSVYGEIRLWHARSRKPVGLTVKSKETVSSVAFARDGRTVVASLQDGTVQAASPTTGKWVGPTLHPLTADADMLALSGDGSEIAAASTDDTSVRLVPVVHPLELGLTSGPRDSDLYQLAFSTDEQKLAAAGGYDSRVSLVDVHTGAMSTPPWLHIDPDADQLAFSPNRQILAARNSDGSVQLWNLESHKSAGHLPKHSQATFGALAFNESGSELAVGDDYGALRLWSVPEQRVVAKTVVQGGVSSLAFVGSDILIVEGNSWAVDRWDGRSAVQHVLTPPDTAQALGVDGSNAWFWKVVAALFPKGGGPLFNGVSVSPDGRTLAAPAALGKDEFGIQLWDVATRTPLGRPLPAFSESAVAFSPDSSVVAAAGGRVRIWQGILWRNAAELKTRICGLVLGGFTADEWSAIAPGVSRPHPCS
jgi:WD40 repeat protein